MPGAFFLGVRLYGHRMQKTTNLMGVGGPIKAHQLLFWFGRRMGEGRGRNRQSPANSGSSGLISVDFQCLI
jgi:hypothetical protein